VLPFVEREYRVSRERTLIGQSLGGLFATELLFRKPYLFTHYLIVSPSLWWDDGSLLQLDHTVLMAPDIGVASVYIVVGDEGRPMLRPAKRLAALLRKGSQARIGYQRIRGLDHSNILHRALMDYFQWRGGK
jgi:predicted alpha/beta superfamily hydrolase